MRLAARLDKITASLGTSEEERQQKRQARYERFAVDLIEILMDGEWHAYNAIAEHLLEEPDDITIIASLVHWLREAYAIDERHYPNLNRSFEIRLASEPEQGATWSELTFYLSDYYRLRAIRLMQEKVPLSEWDDYSRRAIVETARILRFQRNAFGKALHHHGGQDEAILLAAMDLQS